MTNAVGTDDYMALVGKLAATPAVTVRVSLGDSAEIAEARDWVEYLNGDAISTKYGALRAHRGHADPYNVSYFYLGNELWQVRCPHYPANETCYPGPNKTEYADIVRRLVSEMRAASPNHPLRLLTAMGNDPWDGSGWDRAWIAAIGKDIYAASDHDGYLDEPQSLPPRRSCDVLSRPTTYSFPNYCNGGHY